MKKVEEIELWGNKVRCIEKEWISVRDLFEAYGMLRSDKQIDGYARLKLTALVGTENIKKFRVAITKKKDRGRKTHDIVCVRIPSLRREKFEEIFKYRIWKGRKY